MAHKTHRAEVSGKGQKLAIVVGRFNSHIGDALLKGAIDILERNDVDSQDICVYQVPGAFEVPLAAQQLAQKKEFDGVITLGAVIRGDTPHFDFVAGECARGLTRVQLDTGKPIGFGVLTVDTLEQAIERASDNSENKGAETAMTVVEMVNLLKSL